MAGLLLLTLAVPTFGPSVHELLEEHAHFHCTSTGDQHLHEKVVECELCAYLLSFHNYLETNAPVFAEVVHGQTIPAISSPWLLSLDRETPHQRGPPAA